MRRNGFWMIALVCTLSHSAAHQSILAQVADAGWDQKSAVQVIFESSKTASSPEDYSGMLRACDDALARDLTEANRQYLISLKGWAFNRRGQLRFEIAEQLQAAGNPSCEEAFEHAMEDYNRAIQFDPKRWRSWMSRGIAHITMGDFETAAKDFSEVIQLNPKYVNGWFNRAESRFHAGNLAGAISDYESVLAMEPDDLQARNGRGLACLESGDHESALQDFILISRAMPDNRAACLNLGDAYQELARWEEAKNCYQNAVKLYPAADGLQRLAWLRATCPETSLRDPVKAQTLIEQAILVGGETPENLDTLAAVQAARGEFESARHSQQKAIQLVGAEEADDLKSRFQARLALYEEGKPFEQGN